MKNTCNNLAAIHTTTRVNHVEITFRSFRSSNAMGILATLQGDALANNNFIDTNPGFSKQTCAGDQGDETSQKLAAADTETWLVRHLDFLASVQVITPAAIRTC